MDCWKSIETCASENQWTTLKKSGPKSTNAASTAIAHADSAKKLTVLRDKKTTNYCGNFYKSLYLERQDEQSVSVGPCCLSASGRTFKTIDFYQNTELSQIRNSWQHTQIPQCNACWRHEREQIPHSTRQSINLWYQDNFLDLDPTAPELLKLDYNVGPLCNAKCIMCSSHFSSLWAQEDQQFGTKPARSWKQVRTNAIWQNLDFSRLRFLYFNGGEPLLSSEPEAMLYKIRQTQQGLAQLECHLSSNGSVRPSDGLIELWRQCAKVEIWISLDGIQDVFEYIRYPLRWDQTWQNIMFMGNLDPKISVNLGFTIGVHNIDSFPAAYEFIRQHTPNINGGDIGLVRCFGALDIDKASHDLIQLWQQKFKPTKGTDQKLIELYNLVANTNGQPNNNIWKRHLKFIDRRRNLNWTRSLLLLVQQEKKSMS